MQELSGLKDIIVTREKTYGTANHISTGDAGVSDASHWKDAAFGTTEIDGVNEDGDYYVGCQIFVLTGANAGLVRRITAWTDGTDEFTLDSALPSSHGAGDTAVIGKALRAQIESAQIQREQLARDYQSLNWEKPSSVIGKPSGELNFTTEALTDQTTQPLHELLLASLGSRLQSAASNTTAVVAGGSASDLWITLGDYTKFTVGGVVAVESDAGPLTCHYITGITANGAVKDQLALWPPIPAPYPSAGKAVEACNTYAPADTGHIGLTIVVLGNAQYWTFTGCRGTFNMNEFNTGSIAEAKFEMKADQVTITDSVWAGKIKKVNQEPPANYGGVVYDNSTLLSAIKVMLDFGLKLVEKPVFDGYTGRAEWAIVGREPKLTCSIYNNASAETAKLTSGTQMKMFAQMGSPKNAAGALGYVAPSCKVTEMPPGDQDGMGTWEMSMELYDNQQDTTLTQKPVFFFLQT